MVRTPKEKSIARLRKVLNRIPELMELRDASWKLAELPIFLEWKRATELAISHTFEDAPSHIREFKFIHFSPGHPYVPDQETRDIFIRGLEKAQTLLKSMIDEIDEYWNEDVQSSDASVKDAGSLTSTKKVFVVHGHDDFARETVARFLEKLELEPVILHEQANKGRTIIEKFEEHANVAFAVVLLTPDDVGKKNGKTSDPKPRARQNVIFELGFFLGRLGRKHVCSLVKGDVETPSDYDGVVYIPLDDAGNWKMRLVQELKLANFDIDANKAI